MEVRAGDVTGTNSLGDYMNSPIKLPAIPERILYMAGLWTPDELKGAIHAYAEQAVREALDHAFNELNALFMETLKARVPDDDLEDNDEKFNIGICAQALGISRCQHVLQGLNAHSGNNHAEGADQ